jgi:tRNA A-37 threonylcarbamoyl transferase component Bud32/tetratricopeptide (TPR) repeat protein
VLARSYNAWKMGTGQAVPAHPPELIAERYRVESLLGRGGMAAVYQVHDLVRHRTVALKRLIPQDTESAHIARLFEREFHTLSQLVHPRIIEVYDYHTDEQGPFYTMELLSGGDLRQRSPVPWQDLCRLLVDVCSALALLHSRRFVHRDLTPLNIRCTSDGHAKLFDFGSMVQFGRSKHVVGTPPFVAPEALHGQLLDGQTDLFALGATAYYALTGKHAYPARSLHDLVDMWRNAPPVPSQIVPGIPHALDELVMSLLAQSPGARPPSAAEVMERLSAIGQFPIEEALLVGAAYLATPTLVGRDDKLAAFSRQLKRTNDNRGTSILVSGAEGTGRSRLLDACALEAKLSGAIVLRADPSDSGGERWGAAAALFEQLHEQLPELATQLLKPHLALFAPVMLDLARRLQPEPRLTVVEAQDANQPARGELQAMLRDVLITVAQQRTLVLVVDDLELVDEPSAALLALLAHQARNHRLLVLSAITSEHKHGEQRAIKLFTSVSDAIRLRSLDAGQAEQLVVSLFGDVPNARWLADRIFAITRGNPGLVMRVAQHLVDAGIVRYAAGIWTLPSRLDPTALNAALRETLDPSLSEPALDFARALAAADLPRVTLELAVRLSSHRDPSRLQSEIVELTAAGVVSVDDHVVSLSRPSWKRLLLPPLAPEARRALHLRIAECMGPSASEQFRLVEHLLAAGEIDRALTLLVNDVRNNREARTHDPVGLFELVQALPATWPQTLHTCIELCATTGRPLVDKLELQAALTGFATLTARSERAVILDLARQLRHDTGLDLIEQYRGQVPDSELLAKALGDAQKRYDATPENDRGFPILTALNHLAQLVIQAISLAGRMIDLPMLRELPSLEPLAVLSPALAVVHKNVQASLELLRGRSDMARQEYLEIAARLEQPDGAGLNDVHRIHMRYAVIWACGLIEAGIGRPSAEARAAAVEHDPLFAVSALRLRAIAALFRGDRTAAESFRVQTELLQIQNCPPQIFEGSQVTQWVLGYAAIGDLLRVKQYLVEVERLARDQPGYVPVLHCGNGAYQALRGDFAFAQSEYERALEIIGGTDHPVFGFAAGGLIWALARQERYAEAVARGEELLERMRSANIVGNTFLVRVPLAFVQARADRIDAALANISNAIEFLSAEASMSVQLGVAYEVRAQIAIGMRDAEAFSKFSELCLQQYRIGNQAGLLSRHDKLMRAARRANLIVGPKSAEFAITPRSGDDVQSTVSTVLGSAHGPEERAERALALLGRFSRCDVGYLYILQRGGPALVAQLGTAPPMHDMDGFVARFLLDALDHRDVTQTEVASASSVPEPTWMSSSSRRFTPMLLSHQGEHGMSVTGVAVMAADLRNSIRMPTRLLQALSKALYEAGDAITQLTHELEGELPDP